jgi:hypothetical protein
MDGESVPRLGSLSLVVQAVAGSSASRRVSATSWTSAAPFTAALGFLQIHSRRLPLRALHAWLDNWRGAGLIVEGMRRQGYRVSLREIDAWGRELGAVQLAAWVAVKRE